MIPATKCRLVSFNFQEENVELITVDTQREIVDHDRREASDNLRNGKKCSRSMTMRDTVLSDYNIAYSYLDLHCQERKLNPL